MYIYSNKKNKLYVFIMLLFLLFIGGIYRVKANDLPLAGLSFYIDPGHGGIDPGSIYKDIYEKDINLDICYAIKEELENMGANVYMTRYGDYDLSYMQTGARKRSDLNNRAKIINESNIDMYISIHLNSVKDSTWSGAQVFYDDVNPNNIKIAQKFQKYFKTHLNTKREVKEIKTMLLNRKIKIPGVLIEIGFLSNPNDRYLLRQQWYHKKIAKSIKEVLIDYYKT